MVDPMKTNYRINYPGAFCVLSGISMGSNIATFHLEKVGSGQVFPTVWYHGPRIWIAELRIRRLSASDEGEYVWRVTNENGATSEGRLIPTDFT